MRPLSAVNRGRLAGDVPQSPTMVRAVCFSAWLLMSAVVWEAAGRQGVVVLHDFRSGCEGWTVQCPCPVSFRHAQQGRFGRGAVALRISSVTGTCEVAIFKTYRPTLNLRERVKGRLLALCAWVYLPAGVDEWSVLLGVYCGEDWSWCCSSLSDTSPEWRRICLEADSISDPSAIQQMKVVVSSDFADEYTVLLDRVTVLYEFEGDGEGGEP